MSDGVPVKGTETDFMPPNKPANPDPARTLSLLWRHTLSPSRTRGPRPSLTVDRVVEAAVTIADEQGLDAVTVRSVAQALGASPMSVYTYVPGGKTELLELMIDVVYLGEGRPAWGELGWRDRVTAVANQNRALYAKHPWLIHASTSRPPLGPGVITKYEYELSAFDGLGLSDVEVDAALTFVLGFVQANARSAADAAVLPEATAMTDAAWWEAQAELLGRVVDPQTFPRATRIGEAAGAAQGGAYQADAAYRFGMDRVLDGLGRLVERTKKAR
ncbi:TetR/AcrR family transcriptional regulator [Polyangium sorediatum]|uniref:TetR/AcrR family transcriptional regulator n=1 Tax=Polyangium sorediatum TaxID=889274 RepID=A0ABT6NZT0_9BACT|nr:TetR/AcrR family transcriptional regulator [Polyangium sorediatum]MDI1433652.1 TetR/AcrR family transcriptional regulator [Polyangium sorediatum]